jgi:2-methylcitrate dehydratase PrpD
MAGSDRWEWQNMASELGKSYEIEAVCFKAHPSCLGTHAAIEALEHVLEELGVGADQVAHVEVHGGDSLARFRDYRPMTVTDGMFSIPYALALVMLGIEPGPRWWSEDTLNDPAVVRAASKVELLQDRHVTDTAAGERSVRLVVATTDGRVREAEASRPLPRGHTGLGQVEIERKLRAVAEPLLGGKVVTDILTLVGGIEEMPDVSRLTRLLAASSSV